MNDTIRLKKKLIDLYQLTDLTIESPAIKFVEALISKPSKSIK